MNLINTLFFRQIQLQMLMDLTARALQKPSRRIWTMSGDRALRTYALFTRDNLRQGADAVLLSRMRAEAEKMGRWLRRWLWLRRQEDIERFVIALYRNIGIRLEGHLPGHLCFRRCYFSRLYTPDMCKAASALDEGIMQGLCGGGRLAFRRRITEGCDCCLATFSFSPSASTNDTNTQTSTDHL